MNLKGRLLALLALVLAGFLLFSGVALYTLQELKVGGPLYTRIVQGKDLIADILPPPEYIIESYLVTLQIKAEFDANTGPQRIAPLVQRLTLLEKDYLDRHAFWMKETLDGELKKIFLEDSFKDASHFYALTRTRFIPGINASDRAAADAALKEMQLAYDSHRKAIDQVVEISNKHNAAAEKEAADANRFDQALMLAVMVSTLLLAVGYTGRFARQLLHDLGGEPKYAKEVAQRISSGDLSTAIHTRAGDSTSLLVCMRNMQEQLHGLVGQIQGQAAQIGSAVSQLSSASHQVADSSQDQNAAAASMAAAVEELTVSIRQVADNTGGAEAAAHDAGDLAVQGERIMRDAVGEMTRITETVNHSAQLIETLGDHSRQISTIAGVIKEVAEQTNLLALNAAIEAARAGEQGRGFAVVADEVRKLAERTTQSTQKISDTIRGIQNGTAEAIASMRNGCGQIDQGVIMVNQAETTMEQIRLGADKVISEMNDITNSLREQSTTSNQVAQNVEKVAQMSEKNSGAVLDIAATVQTLDQLANSLNESVCCFRI